MSAGLNKLVFGVIPLAFVLIIAGCSNEDNPTAPEGIKNSDIKVLVLKDGGTEDSVYSVLSKQGFDVTVGEFFYTFDGKFVDNYNLIIFLNGVNYSNNITEDVQNRLKNYVRDGGILLTTEWMTYSIQTSNYYQVLKEILPSMYNGNYDYGTETYVKEVNHPITEGLPVSFSISNEAWSYSITNVYSNSLSGNLKVLFSGSKSGAALTIGELNKGKTIHWNMAGAYDGNTIWTSEVKKILVNIARYSGM